MKKRIQRLILGAVTAALGAQAVVAWVNVTAEVWDVETGALLERQETHNKVVDAGLNLIRDLINGDVAAGVTHFAVGTSGTAVAAGDTALGAEVARQTVTQKTKAAGKLTVKYYLPSGTANGSTLRECGLFNAASGGALYARVVLTNPIPKSISIAVTFTWDLTWGAA